MSDDRSDEMYDWYGEDERFAPTTWEAVDLGPYLRGEVQRPTPSVGVYRSDGIQFLYPGREHSILGGTEAGKTWVALQCVAAELLKGSHVVYIHFEESDPGSTVERLRLLGISDAEMVERLHFAAPAKQVMPGWLNPLLEVRPSLVILDGINEAIVLHGHKVDLDGWSLFRQQVIIPFKDAGAAVLGCDHMPINNDEGRRDAYGTGHKGNVLDGSRLMLVNKDPFGQRMRGRSNLFVTKDRPGQLRIHGKPGKTPGVTFLGTLVVDDSQSDSPDFIAKIYAPREDEATPETDPQSELKAVVHQLVAEMPGGRAGSKRKLLAAFRNAGHSAKSTSVDDAVDDLVDAGLLIEVPGTRGSLGYEATLTASRPSSESTASALPPSLLPATASPIRGEAVEAVSSGEWSSASRSSGKRWEAVEALEEVGRSREAVEDAS